MRAWTPEASLSVFSIEYEDMFAVRPRHACTFGFKVHKASGLRGIGGFASTDGWHPARKSSRCRHSCSSISRKADLAVGQVHILPLEEEDLAAASVVLTRSFATSLDSVTVSLSKVDDFLRKLQDQSAKGVLLIARLFPADVSLRPRGRQHRVVGTAAVTFADEEDAGDEGEYPLLPADSAHLTNMAVDGKLRKHGIARLLLAACEEHARQIGSSSISLAVHQRNTPARQLYLSAGYTEAELRQPKGPLIMMPGRRWQHTVMRKELNVIPPGCTP